MNGRKEGPKIPEQQRQQNGSAEFRVVRLRTHSKWRPKIGFASVPSFPLPISAWILVAELEKKKFHVLPRFLFPQCGVYGLITNTRFLWWTTDGLAGPPPSGLVEFCFIDARPIAFILLFFSSSPPDRPSNVATFISSRLLFSLECE